MKWATSVDHARRLTPVHTHMEVPATSTLPRTLPTRVHPAPGRRPCRTPSCPTPLRTACTLMSVTTSPCASCGSGGGRASGKGNSYPQYRHTFAAAFTDSGHRGQLFASVTVEDRSTDRAAGLPWSRESEEPSSAWIREVDTIRVNPPIAATRSPASPVTSSPTK